MTDVYFYDEVGDGGITAQDAASVLATISGDVTVRLNSPGGSATAGLAIHSLLASRPGTVHVVVDGLAASAASVIMMAASAGCLSVAPGGLVMIHDAFAACFGNSADLTAQAAVLDKASATIAAVYARRSGLDAGMWRDAMRAETWFTAQEAVDAGLADRVLETARA